MNSIYVENLPEETSEEDVLDMFANAGQVSFVSVDRDAEAGGSKKVAYVHFEDGQAAQNAIDQYDNQHILYVELQVGLQVLSEIFQDQERPSAESLTVIVPRLKGFRLLPRIYEAYTRGEITRPLKVGCVASVPLAELWPGARLNPFEGVDDRRPVTVKRTTDGQTNFYKFNPSS